MRIHGYYPSSGAIAIALAVIGAIILGFAAFGAWVARKAKVAGWQIVPPRVVLKELAPDGRSHACVTEAGTWLCFLGGSPRS